MPIAPDFATSAQAYLREFERFTRERGEMLFARGAVLSLEQLEDGSYTATVQGTKRYQLTLFLEDEEWFGDCTCPVGSDCKHCYAVMRALFEPGTARTAARVAKVAKPKPSKNPFIALIEGKLGRKVTAGERRAVVAIDDLFKYHGSAKFVADYLLVPITGERQGWNYQMFELWPAPPQSAWEAWLYVAHFLRQQQRAGPAFLAQITPEAELDAFVAAWERKKKITEWEQRIGHFADSRRPLDGGDAVELRAVFERDGVRLEARGVGGPDFAALKKTRFTAMEMEERAGRLALTGPSRLLWAAFRSGHPQSALLAYAAAGAPTGLNELLRNPLLTERVLSPRGEPFRRAEERLRWHCEPASDDTGEYLLALVRADGTAPPPALVVIDGRPALYVTDDTIYEAPPLGGLSGTQPDRIPAPALETRAGVAMLDAVGVELPPRLAARTRSVRRRVIFRCLLRKNSYGDGERMLVTIRAEGDAGSGEEVFSKGGWVAARVAPRGETEIIREDRTAQHAVPAAVEALRLSWNSYTNVWEREAGRKLPGEFTAWLAALPPGLEVELDPLLATLRDAPIAASVRLEVEESGVDWFDLRVALQVEDTTLTQEELKLLLDARGGFVRLGAKGWRRLEFQLSDEEERELADLGLTARELSSEPQRLHALQLAGQSAARLLPERHAAAVRRRAEEIQTRVAPPVPATIQAELRPYQLEGFHFLAYLTANHFGGILADDMGLGKTVQTLTWLAWLRDTTTGSGAIPSLVVCPKSVVANWAAEAARFLPTLRVRTLGKGACDAAALAAARAEGDLVVANYAHLRLLETELAAAPWQAVILDEAQAIKNPESQTARIALTLPAAHRLALSGTPIENRLLDLWSILAFAMPGVLGPRAQFSRRFEAKGDPLARRRLAARVRPFLLRRTKNEVARDLPERIEEDLVCEMEGVQATLYRAELKRARQALLKLKTQRELDRARFNLLTSLLRLRQICCHPGLVSASGRDASSAKLTALLELLEPLIEEGHKVLVFSQFVEMLARIRTEVQARGWREFLLTGATEDRGPLVEDFQQTEGPAVFLISLRAGGFGLNLTAASYVVLFDPWWNPAVEQQAIDRTHRIGQTSTVFAYRLIAKDSIEEKIRLLQKQKQALAADILGEESFARGLTLDDFQFLLAE